MMRYLPILLACALSACAQTTPQWDARFGIDTRMVLAQQIMHPGAARNTDSVSGMDGRSARAAYDRYQKAGAEQPPAATASGAK
jgi:hypothetical protein